MTTPAVDVRLAERDPRFLACGDKGHPWDDPSEANLAQGEWQVQDRTRGGRPRTVYREITCIRCGSVRRDLYAVTPWRLLEHRYDYPEGYRIVNDGQPRLRRADNAYARFAREFKAANDKAAK